MTREERESISKWFIAKAKETKHKEGDLEIDDNAAVSIGSDPGAYVQAWVWIDNPKCHTCEEIIDEINHVPEDGKFLCSGCTEEDNGTD